MFCHKCGAPIAEGAVFCEKCGTRVLYTDAGPQVSPSYGSNTSESPTFSQSDRFSQSNAPSQNNTYSQDNTHVHSNTLQCPNCHSTDIIPIIETSTNVSGGGYGVGKGCCGWILFGPLGLLCGLCGTGVKSHTQTKTYWVCRSCGNKFRSQADTVAEQAAEVMPGSVGVLIGSIVLCIIGNLFADYDISFLGLSNWIYTILGTLGICVSVLVISLAVLTHFFANLDNIGKLGEANKSAMQTYMAAFVISLLSLIAGIISALGGGKPLLWIPTWVYIVLGLLGTLLFGFMSDAVWTLGSRKDGKAVLAKKYGSIFEKLASVFSGKK